MSMLFALIELKHAICSLRPPPPMFASYMNKKIADIYGAIIIKENFLFIALLYERFFETIFQAREVCWNPWSSKEINHILDIIAFPFFRISNKNRKSSELFVYRISLPLTLPQTAAIRATVARRFLSWLTAILPVFKNFFCWVCWEKRLKTNMHLN